MRPCRCLRPTVPKLHHLAVVCTHVILSVTLSPTAGVGLYRHRPPRVQPCSAVKHKHSRHRTTTPRAMLCSPQKTADQTTAGPQTVHWRRFFGGAALSSSTCMPPPLRTCTPPLLGPGPLPPPPLPSPAPPPPRPGLAPPLPSPGRAPLLPRPGLVLPPPPPLWPIRSCRLFAVNRLQVLPCRTRAFC